MISYSQIKCPFHDYQQLILQSPPVCFHSFSVNQSAALHLKSGCECTIHVQVCFLEVDFLCPVLVQLDEQWHTAVESDSECICFKMAALQEKRGTAPGALILSCEVSNLSTPLR